MQKDCKTTEITFERVDIGLLNTLEEAKKSSILSKIGNTPIVKLERIKSYIGIPRNITLWAKLEGFNPGGSVKDRPAFFMIEDGVKTGKLTRDKILIDSTSGNTGIAYAMICAVLGIKVILCIPANASFERLKILTIFGAELRLTNPLEGSDGAIIEARKIYESDPSKYFKPDQYSNQANPLSHYYTTSLEIWRDTGGNIDFFIGGVGTGGVIMGNGRRLRELNKNVKIIAVEPEEPIHGLEGLRNTNYSYIPPIFDVSFPDMYIRVRTEDAYQMCRLLALKEGLFVGGSSGAVMKAAEIFVKNYLIDGSYPRKDYNIVLLFPDSGDRYFSSRLWEDKKFADILSKIRWKKDS